eukprot:TRINITY_DN995_c0_g1_i1.p1 TRINITY_DN995_c0_g1~~TRINITY_DN995_c0_g1_i1.p1  ORF type:complete len:146 (+),score=23.56 TRINITY_DN995_c0_g1_i1:2-439(+)
MLLQIPHVKAFRARALFDSGFQTIEQVSEASVEDIKGAISKYSAFSSSKSNVEGKADHKYREHVESQTARLIKKGARSILAAQVEDLEFEAEQMELAQQQEFQYDRRRRRNQLQNDEHESAAQIFDEMRDIVSESKSDTNASDNE